MSKDATSTRVMGEQPLHRLSVPDTPYMIRVYSDEHSWFLAISDNAGIGILLPRIPFFDAMTIEGHTTESGERLCVSWDFRDDDFEPRTVRLIQPDPHDWFIEVDPVGRIAQIACPVAQKLFDVLNILECTYQEHFLQGSLEGVEHEVHRRLAAMDGEHTTGQLGE
jgi:hypothetical protein